jgi:hypothetical protein
VKRVLLLLALLPVLASAQLQLYVAPQGGEETLFTGSYDMGSVAVADSASMRFRLRNTGKASITLSYLYVSGTGFSTSGAPSLPFIVAPGLNVDFTVRFSPPNFGSYSANLQVNSTGFIVRGSGLAGAAMRVNGADVPSGGPIDFGRVERGSTSSLTLELINRTTEPVSIPALTLTGSSFSMPNGNPAPLTLRPGESNSFEIRFSPLESGILSGSLGIDRRTFRLTGTGYEPTMPRPTVVIESSAIRSGEQGRVSIQLASASRSNAKGQLRMELRPVGTAKDNDSGAQFVSGSRTVAFDVAPGDTTVKLRGQDSIVFQAGTTAGTIVFVVEAGGFTEQASVTVAPEPVRIDKATALRNASSINIQVTGFDNTRSLDEMSFTFVDKSGQPLPNMPIKVPVAENFGPWWTSSNLGGIFQVTLSFPVSGDTSKLGGVQVQLTNSGGPASTNRLTF